MDSQLVTKQIRGEYQAKDLILFSYRQEVQGKLSELATVEIRKSQDSRMPKLMPYLS